MPDEPPISKTEQVSKYGNSVWPPPIAAELVKANYEPREAEPAPGVSGGGGMKCRSHHMALRTFGFEIGQASEKVFDEGIDLLHQFHDRADLGKGTSGELPLAFKMQVCTLEKVGKRGIKCDGCVAFAEGNRFFGG
jgi:hypothetical protein